MARGHRLNTSIVLAAVHGLLGLSGRCARSSFHSLATPPTPHPTMSLSLISILASVNVKQSVYLPEDLKLSQVGSSPLPPPFRELHSPAVRKHCQIIFACYFRKSSIGYASEGVLHSLFTDAVSALRKVWVLWGIHGIQRKGSNSVSLLKHAQPILKHVLDPLRIQLRGKGTLFRRLNVSCA